MLVSRIKRVGLSLLSALASELVVASYFALRENHGLEDLPWLLFAYSIFVIPGWLLSLPMVLSFNRIDGWRLWLLGTYGILVGPVIVLIWATMAKLSSGDSILVFLPFAGLALVIASLSTALYLSAFRYLSRDSIEAAR